MLRRESVLEDSVVAPARGGAYGFHSARSLIGLIFLCCTGLTLHPVFKSP